MIQKLQDAMIASTLVNYSSSKDTTTTEASSPNTTVQQNTAAGNAASVQASDQSAAQDDRQKDNKDGDNKLTKDDANNITDALNELMDKMNCDLEFKYYDKLDQLTVKMIDKKTKETIKEFPPEDIIKTMIKTKEWIGTFLDKLA